MIITDRIEIENRINYICNNENEIRAINIDMNDFKPLLESKELSAIVAEAEDMANLVVTLLREMGDANAKRATRVLLSISCSHSYGLNMSDMQKLQSVMGSLADGADLIWGVSYNDNMPMNKIKVSIFFGR